uniref:Rab3 GTPase-activating protein catalytic subunit n=1 Tax=Schistocephalus solidus TaxID=70667 RepID=A0A183TPC2_SCHSO
LTSSSSASYDDSDSEISSADKEISWTSDISDVAANNSSSTPSIEEEPTVREDMSSWAIRSRWELIHLSSLLKIIRRLTSDIPADARTRLCGASDVSTVPAMGSEVFNRWNNPQKADKIQLERALKNAFKKEYDRLHKKGLKATLGKSLEALPTLDNLDTFLRFCNLDDGLQIQLMIEAGSDGYASLIGGQCSQQGCISMMIS